ncbi:MAG TPA: TMEM175 family protein [Puia sp.]|nr:TMEM175 family protein [Puia sp.]
MERPRDHSLERINAFSDGIFAIIITIMVLELKKPEEASFKALGELWPTWLSYIVSYLFIAIVWTNHHYLLKNASHVTHRLVWANFGHLFAVSLIPFLTTWIADTRLAAVPTAMYAFVFFLVNLTYLGLIYQTNAHRYRRREKGSRSFRIRSVATLVSFLSAVGLSFWHPSVGFAIVAGCLLLYIKPEGQKRGVKTV